MNQNKSTFEKERLQPDYIAFKFIKLDWFRKKDVLNYLFDFEFNIYEGLPPKVNSKRVNSKNKFTTYVTENIPDWPGTVSHFTGKNAKQF